MSFGSFNRSHFPKNFAECINPWLSQVLYWFLPFQVFLDSARMKWFLPITLHSLLRRRVFSFFFTSILHHDSHSSMTVSCPMTDAKFYSLDFLLMRATPCLPHDMQAFGLILLLTASLSSTPPPQVNFILIKYWMIESGNKVSEQPLAEYH